MIGNTFICTGCRNPFLVVSGSEELCPVCERDSALYQASRKKGDPRQFLPYRKLLEQWRNRRKECKEWCKLAEEANAALKRGRELEAENAALRLGVDAPTESLSAEVLKLREELSRLTRDRDHWRERFRELRDDRWPGVLRALQDRNAAAIPADMLKRLRGLCHPDRWHDTPQEKSATTVMQWLNRDVKTQP